MLLFQNNLLKYISEYSHSQQSGGGSDWDCHNPSPSHQLTCSHYSITEKSTAREIRQAQSSCAVTFMIPGFMKSGTTFL